MTRRETPKLGQLPVHRRSFLKSSALISMAPLVPGFVGNTCFANQGGAEQPILVIIEMSGGNDGLNTVVPYRQNEYERFRKSTRIDKNQVLKIDDNVGLNPAMVGFKELYDDGMLGIIHGVGYPNPNRSHFESMAIWHSAQLSGENLDGNGWLGRYLDASIPAERVDLDGWYVGAGTTPAALVNRKSQVAAIERLQDLRFKSLNIAKQANQLGPTNQSDISNFVSRSMASSFASAQQLESILENEKNDSRFPSTPLGNKLSIVSRLIRSGAASRAYYTVQPGYDTHSGQLGQHARLLGDLSSSVKAFVDDLKLAGINKQVVIMAYSEFGRRVAENRSQGTDHGTAGPVFVVGNCLLYTSPSPRDQRGSRMPSSA